LQSKENIFSGGLNADLEQKVNEGAGSQRNQEN
jgi:hypothetical protein